jgi:hypothetical protein
VLKQAHGAIIIGHPNPIPLSLGRTSNLSEALEKCVYIFGLRDGRSFGFGQGCSTIPGDYNQSKDRYVYDVVMNLYDDIVEGLNQPPLRIKVPL